MRVATSIIIKKMVTNTEWFRYVVLEQTADTEVRLMLVIVHSCWQMFQYPLALSKLALFLVDAIYVHHCFLFLYLQCTQERRNRGPPALMICLYIEKRNIYLIVGVTGRTAGPRKKYVSQFV